MSSRVEWTRLDGDEVETVLSISLYRERPRAVRVRASRGDGGLDVVVPSESHPGRIDVYQIKKFAENLTANQKRQIDNSFLRLLHGVAANDHQVADWHLMMPLDPTKENLAWFEQLGARALATLDQSRAIGAAQSGGAAAGSTDEGAGEDVSVESGLSDQMYERVTRWLSDRGFVSSWDGLIACDSLAAKYSDVIDYYLHGGRARVESAVAQVAAVLGGDRRLGDPSGPALQPVDVVDHLKTLQSALDTDPHYRYGVSLDPQRPALPPEPDLVAATQQTAPNGSTLTFRIYARFAEAVEVRPIPLRLNFAVVAGTPDAEALELFRKYGKPMTVPASVSADLPGGLGGEFTNGTVALGPAADATTAQLRFRLLDQAGTELAVLPVHAGPTSIAADGQGAHRETVDATGAVEIELLTRLDDLSCTLNASFGGEFDGSPVADAAAAATFMSHWRAGNKLELAAERGRFGSVMELTSDVETDIHPMVVRVLGAMAAIQDMATGVLHVPRLDELSVEQAREIVNSAELVRGRTLLGQWSGVELGQPAEEGLRGVECEATVRNNYSVTIGDQVVFLGVSSTHLDSAVVAPTGDRIVPGSSRSARMSLDVSAQPLTVDDVGLRARA